MTRKVAIVAMALACALGLYYGRIVIEARRMIPLRFETEAANVSEPFTAAELGIDRVAQLLKAQDENFFTHGGTDFMSGRMTTITQSLVKQLHFESFKPGLAKIEQSLVAAFALDPLVTKDEQLSLFLNRAYFGHDEGRAVHGFREAARAYFEKPVTALTEDEYLGLLAMLSGPNELSVKLHPEANLASVKKLRQKLATK